MKGVFLGVVVMLVGCSKAEEPVSWQPHEFHPARATCKLDVPPGFTRAASPMPDHLAELMTPDLRTLVVDERTETSVEQAEERVHAYYKDRPPGPDDHVVLMRLPGLRVVEVVGHRATEEDVMTVASSLRCTLI